MQQQPSLPAQQLPSQPQSPLQLSLASCEVEPLMAQSPLATSRQLWAFPSEWTNDQLASARSQADCASPEPEAAAGDGPSCFSPELPFRRRRWSNVKCSSSVLAPVRPPPQDEDSAHDELLLSNTCIGLQNKLGTMRSEDRFVPPLRL
uniref:Uncharacterized protein n=1 Tax=Alexandrium catenella TaxID=2925 RepID=A0A7S1SBF4_ALECA